GNYRRRPVLATHDCTHLVTGIQVKSTLDRGKTYLGPSRSASFRSRSTDTTRTFVDSAVDIVLSRTSKQLNDEILLQTAPVLMTGDPNKPFIIETENQTGDYHST
ncbi:hypothetical protein BGZ94_005564, partial [Podila epigama]